MAKKTRSLGRRAAIDERDRLFLMARRLPKAGTPLPTRKTWAIAPKALDQGDTGTCVGHGWANFLRCQPIRSNAGIEELRFEIYDKAILIDEWSDNDIDPDRQFGTSVRAGAEVVTSMGRLKSYLWAFDLRTAVEWVLLEGPVVLGTNWYDSMFDPNSEGIVTIKANSRLAGGHCYLLRGVDTRKGLARCSNSWGDEFGLSGDFLIPFRDLERLIHEQGEACSAVEQRLKAKAV